jgi:hypothetical protein
MSEHEPLSVRQVEQVNKEVAELAVRVEQLVKLMLAAHGPEDATAVRAQEIRDAIQRFQWAMERQIENREDDKPVKPSAAISDEPVEPS